MVIPTRSSTNGTLYLMKKYSEYLAGVLSNLNALKIPVTVAVDGILRDEHTEIIVKYGGNAYITPHLLSLRNKIAEASRECELKGQTIVELEENEKMSDLTSDQIAEFLLSPRESNPEMFEIEGTASEETEGLIRELCQFCNVTFRKVVSNQPIEK
jgi:hypothetical protein